MIPVACDPQHAHARWNYVLFVLDGGTYGAGVAFVATDTVLPSMIRSLGGSDWLIALCPSLMLLGYMVTPFLLAHRVERLSLFRPVTFWGSLPQRLPPLLAAAAVFFGWSRWPSLALWAVFLSPFLQGMCGGLIATAFFELFAKVIPVNRRAGNTAWRGVVGTGLGVISGLAVVKILGAWPGRLGYSILLLLQFGCFVLSWLCIGLVRETPETPAEPAAAHPAPWGGVAGMVAAVRGNPSFRRFMLAKVFAAGCGVVVPFLALYFRARFALAESFVGWFVQAETAGGIVGAVLGGYLGDRIGAKLPLCLSRLMSVAVCMVLFTLESQAGAVVCFALLGVSVGFGMVTENVLLLEICPRACRPTLIAVQFFIAVAATLAASWLTQFLYRTGGGIFANAIASALFAACSCLVLLTLVEPRAKTPSAVAEAAVA